jgi:hypothetical protein
VRRSVLGAYRVNGRGDISSTRFGAYRRTPTDLQFLGERQAPPAALKVP